ncbi:endonuclease domain-containing protein [Microterricola viridarii]|uniref:DUF559 domain-containing protein n=1 Tax=Microterricola viridarii TaxID=412690 RepID=A0A1H1XCZ0_9MICO|nr:DUF559 domain-containing protein [Microterricola viridarii]SDT06941.1 Protein of unknown function [Microterricola viridarii]
MPRLVPLPPGLAGRAFSIADARESGLTVGRLRSGDLAAPFHGVRVPASLDLALLERCQAYATRMRPGQFFSQLTAARLWGAPLAGAFEPDEPLHVSARSPQRPPHTSGVIGHDLPAGGASASNRYGLPVATAADTWLQLAALLPPAELVVVGDHLVLNPQLFDPGDPRPYTSIAALAEPLGAFRGRGKRAAVSAVVRVRVGAESRPETLLRLVLVNAGLPEPLLNRELRDSAGVFLGRVDMVYPEWRVVVEYDGDQHRTSSRQYDRDLTRLDGLRRAGWTVIRVRKFGLFERPERTVAEVRAALVAGGYHP